MNPAQELIDELFGERNLPDKLNKMIDLWASFVVPGCFDRDVVQRCDLKAMIDKFIRMVLSPIDMVLNPAGLSLFEHTIIPYTARKEATI